jgi:type I restriction enzyme S subunit
MITEASEYITEDAYSNSSARWVPEGALVMALAGQGKTKGMVAQLAIRATCNQSMAAIVPAAEVNPRYLYWWLDAQYQNIRNLAGGDLRDGLNLDLLGQIPCPLPAKDEQSSISFFLDRETAKIDALMAEQERLIELLEEKRKAVISHAVTKGLDPTVPMKDSGVEWLGKVPRHWRVERLKYSIRNCRNGTWGADAQGDQNDIPCVRVADFNRTQMRVQLSDPTIRNVPPNERLGRILERGNLLLEKSGGGDLQPVGFVVLYDDSASAVCSNFIARVVLAPAMSPRYWGYVHSTLYRARVNIRSINQTSGIQNLDQDRYFNELAPFPSIDEQKAIEEFIDLETNGLDHLIAEAQRVIASLDERRSALISAAVTGQIDVRQLEVA